MTHLWIRTATVGLAASLAMALAGCESTPRYPTTAGQAPGTGPRMATPAYPVRQAAESAPPAAPRVDEAGDPIPPAQPTTPVDRSALAPVTTESLPPVQKPQRMSYDPQADAARALFGDLGDETGLIRTATHHPLAPADAPATKKKPAKAAPAKASTKKAETKKAATTKASTTKASTTKASTKKAPPAKPCKGKHCKAEPEPKKAAASRSTSSAGLRGRRTDVEAAPSSRSRRAEAEAAPVKSSTKATPGVIAGGAVVSAEGPPVSYKIKNGDTLDGIARKLDTTRRQLIEDNDLKSPYVIRPGKTLMGPASHGKAYVVQAGDTLYAIARRFSVEARELADYNDIKVSTALKPGRKLLLPPGFKDKGVPKPPAPPRPKPPVVRPQESLPPAGPAYQPPSEPEPSSNLPPIGATPARPPLSGPTTTAPQTTAPQNTAPQTTAPAGPARPQPYRPANPTYPTPSYPVRPPPATTTPSQPMIETAPPLSDSEIAAAGRGRFSWPVRGDILKGYGPLGGGQRNDGIDIQAPSGTPVLAAATGEVVYAGDQVPGFGNLVLIKHPDGWVTAYAHLARTDVKMRQQVTQGMQIGLVGSTGITGEPQLHFEVRYSPSAREKARAVNPALVLPQ